jgi:hypothetical protein
MIHQLLQPSQDGPSKKQRVFDTNPQSADWVSLAAIFRNLYESSR